MTYREAIWHIEYAIFQNNPAYSLQPILFPMSINFSLILLSANYTRERWGSGTTRYATIQPQDVDKCCGLLLIYCVLLLIAGICYLNCLEDHVKGQDMFQCVINTHSVSLSCSQQSFELRNHQLWFAEQEFLQSELGKVKFLILTLFWYIFCMSPMLPWPWYPLTALNTDTEEKS